jgi:2-methylcitrate dehydratase PrpD
MADAEQKMAESLGATRRLAGYIAQARPEDLPLSVRKEAIRTFFNWLGCAVGGSTHPAVGMAIDAVTPFAGPAQATVLGRSERLDALNAALVNGISSHVFDFDDTHLRTVIHPAGPVASALLAFSEYRPVDGARFLNALALGVEAECRIGNAVFPAHYEIGWHITGTTGVFGAAAAVGKLLGLDAQRMTWAFGLAATQPVGLREMFGSMTKSFHPGRAAQNGMTAALLAERGFTSSDQAIEAKRGWAHVLSAERNFAEIVDGLGETYEILRNSYKPFACGIVIHPAIDGAIRLRNQHKLTADQIARIELRVHPLVLELTGKTNPQTGLEGKFSVYYSVAIAIIEGEAGEAQYNDEAARAPQTVALRNRVHATVDPTLEPDAAHVEITLTNGEKLAVFVEHAIGSVARPMSDDELQAKFLGLATGALPERQVRDIVDLCWRVENLADVSTIAKACARIAT